MPLCPNIFYIEHDALPVVGEISDDSLNDLMGQHLRKVNVCNTIRKANAVNTEEGDVWGGILAVTALKQVILGA